MTFNVIIPCAGTGSRANLSYPKSLFKLGSGKTILVTILEKFMSALGSDVIFVIVINPEDHKTFSEELLSYRDIIKYVFQSRASGTATAVHLAVEKISSEQQCSKFFLAWGDCVGFSVDTIKKLKSLWRSDNSIVPCFFSEEPYTSISLHADSTIATIRETRNERQTAPGYTDIGVFSISIGIREALRAEISESETEHRENSFIRALNKFAKDENTIDTVIVNPSEKLGLNYLSDLQ